MEQQSMSVSAPEVRGRRLMPRLIPAGVILATMFVLIWSLWPVVRPARPVQIAQAVFDRTATPEPAPDADDDDPPAGPTVQAAGWLEAEPFFIACTALTDGIVESIHVLEGDAVESGDVVANLVDDDSIIRLRLADAMLASAEADLKVAIAEREAAETQWAEPVQLDRAVDTSKALIAQRRADRERLPHLIDAARATLERLREEFERIESSRSRNAASDIEVIIRRQRLVAQAAEVAALEARLPLIDAEIEQFEAEHLAARRDRELRIADRQRLETARAQEARARATVDHRRASRDEAALELDRMTITAPITGYVQRRLKRPGDKVMLGMDEAHSSHVLHLYDPDRLQVRVDVPLADAAHVRLGQRCDVIVDVLPDRTFEGEVIRTTHEADLQKNTLQFKVRIIDPSPLLRPEMLTRVRFRGGGPARDGATTDANQPAMTMRLLVPEAALDTRDGRTRIWTVSDRHQGRGVVQPHTVETMRTDDGWVAIAGAIQPGAWLALDPGDLHEGQRVTVARNTDVAREGAAP